jgi:hypothetical protein
MTGRGLSEWSTLVSYRKGNPIELLINIKLVFRLLPATNTLAYFARASVMKRKGFLLTLTEAEELGV